VLKEAEAGAKAADLARRHGVSEATSYNWRSKYGGLEISEARRLKVLESENAKLKRLLADAMLDQAALKDLLAKSFDARRKAGSCGSSPGLPWDERAAGVPCHRCRSRERALPFHAGR
jgi:putative transposase